MNDDSPHRRSLASPVGLCALIVLISVAVFGLTGTRTEIWDGGYPYVACEFTFTDPDGSPLEGVTLQVERSGIVRPHIPIDDFYPGRIPTSDKSGVLRFHCCGHRFGGTCHTYFHVIHIGGCGAPLNNCRFVYRGSTISVVSFSDLAFPKNDQKLPRVKRSLALPAPELTLSESIPPVSKLPTAEYEFMLVKRSVVVPR